MDFKRIMNYCGKLQLNNNRTWFHENHDEYDEAKKDFLGFIDRLRFVINDEAPDIGKAIMYMERGSGCIAWREICVFTKTDRPITHLSEHIFHLTENPGCLLVISCALRPVAPVSERVYGAIQPQK